MQSLIHLVAAFHLPNFVVYPAAVFFVLGVLVFVHEFGHYAVAKWCGVRVETFSLGFGKRLWGFRRGDTDYRISLLPLGGYVKMAGENPMEDRSGDPGEFTSHPRWQRFLIAIAGPTMNIIFAFVAWTVIFMVHYEYPAFTKEPALIGWVEKDSAAEKAGIKPGDKVIKIQDQQSPTWEQVLMTTMLSPSQPMAVEIQRGSETFATNVTPETVTVDRIGLAGWIPQEPVIVATVDPGPAQRAGIEPGDTILAINDVPLRNFNQMLDAVQQNGDKSLSISVLRKGKTLTFAMKPELTDRGPEEGGKRYRISISRERLTKVDHLSFAAAVKQAASECQSKSLLMFDLVGKMVAGKLSPRSMSGPIGIGRISGQAAQQSMPDLFNVMAFISLNLAVINLLPIPILDGGLMLMLVIEGIIRRDIKQEVKERVYQVAFVFLLLFTAAVIYNDLSKLPVISRYMP
ncbi:MAG TPA: RIP metalloprotease RseP [Alphaproteobacteria bacterium]|nr:RIP metalloprotease RseP [Alphaproteobacteria bacterium]